MEKKDETTNTTKTGTEMVERDSSGRFVKGHTPHKRAGRKARSQEFKEACEQRSMQALGVLVEIMTDETQPASARILAAKTIIEQANGKPFQAMKIEDIDTTIHIVDDDPEGAEYNG